MKLKMEDLPRKIRREIKKANKLSNKLRRKMWLKNAKSRCTKDTFTEIEVKCSYEDFIAGKIPSIEEAKEYAYFYKRDDGYFGAEKIKNGKLKEFYEMCIPHNKNVYEKMNYTNICSGNITDLLKEIEILIENKNNIFCINGVKYYVNYFSIDPKSLDSEHIYIYPLEIDSIKDLSIFYMFKNFFKYNNIFKNLEGIYFPIFRYNKNRKIIDLIYLENLYKDFLNFYYFNIENKNLLSLREMLIRI